MERVKDVISKAKRLNLLYVEDDIDSRRLAVSILSEFFDNIVEADDGEDGIDKFQANSIDLIITDINMPKMNGFDMIRRLKNQGCDIPIIILSAYSDTSYLIDAIELNVDGYILKPIEIKQVIELLDKIIDRIMLKNRAEEYKNFLIQYREAIDSAALVSTTDTYGRITYVNDAFANLMEYSKDELIGKKHNIFRHPNTPDSLYEDMWNTIKNRKQLWKGIIRNRTKYGKNCYLKTIIKPILNKDNEILEYIAIRDDITDIMNPQKQLQDLINLSKSPVAILMKIEDFNTIEKLYGVNIAQDFENMVEREILRSLPKGYEFGQLFQLGLGWFALSFDVEYFQVDLDKLKQDIVHFQKEINKRSVDIGDVKYNISILISMSQGRYAIEDAKLGIELLYESDSDFIDAYGFFENHRQQIKKNIEIMRLVKDAIENNRIVSYFQPIVNNKTQEIEKYESLVRLIDSDNNVLPPYYFLNLSKKSRYYQQITMNVLKNSFGVLNKTKCAISINLSIIDIESDTIKSAIASYLDEYKYDRDRIIFELLEDEAVEDFDTVREFVEFIESKGVKIAIDDFGSGYSNFHRILEIKPDILKIDASLIRNIENSNISYAITKTIVAFAKLQGIQTVAEFVENEKIFKILLDLGVDYSQGYYFGKPEVL